MGLLRAHQPQTSIVMAKKYTYEDFISKAKQIHGEKLDFSEFVYTNSISKGKLKCNECGHVWETRADVILRGCGCPVCIKKKNGLDKVTPFEKVIEQIKDTIEFNKDTYIDTRHKVEAHCKVCGHIWYPNVRDLMGKQHGCPSCAMNELHEKTLIRREKRAEEKKRLEEERLECERQERSKLFIDKANKKFKGKYDYSEVRYVNSTTLVNIICPKHGVFQVTPKNHLKCNGSCPQCIPPKPPMTLEEFRIRFNEKHEGLYTFDESSYSKASEMVTCECPIHGTFTKLGVYLLAGGGCPKCGKIYKLDNDSFIERARNIHGDKYDYFKVKYVNNRTHVEIICPKHGSFMQTPNDHLDGCGCPKCCSSKMERWIRHGLTDLNVIDKFTQGKSVPFLVNPDTGYLLTLDFFSKDMNLAIECQGDQHFESIPFFGGDEALASVQSHDAMKKKLCKENGVELIYLLEEKYNSFMKEDDIFFNKAEDVVKYIKSKFAL